RPDHAAGLRVELPQRAAEVPEVHRSVYDRRRRGDVARGRRRPFHRQSAHSRLSDRVLGRLIAAVLRIAADHPPARVVLGALSPLVAVVSAAGVLPAIVFLLVLLAVSIFCWPPPSACQHPSPPPPRRPPIDPSRADRRSVVDLLEHEASSQVAGG